MSTVQNYSSWLTFYHLDTIGTDLTDSGILEGSGSDATPVSIIEPVQEPLIESKPTPNKMPAITTKPIAVKDLENYVVAMHNDDRDALRKEYQVLYGKLCVHYNVYYWKHEVDIA